MPDHINVNDQVWVRLTAAGNAVYESDPARQMIAERLPQYAQPVEGVMSFPLWKLMVIFGPHMRLGGQVLFEDQRVHFKDPEGKETL